MDKMNNFVTLRHYLTVILFVTGRYNIFIKSEDTNNAEAY